MLEWFNCLGEASRGLIMVCAVIAVIGAVAAAFVYHEERLSGGDTSGWPLPFKLVAWVTAAIVASLLIGWIVTAVYQMITCL